mmetsp:Transcript_20577/g.66265  ORF Transcript_20577/g.66265 Transcript_20577/m.66265 type:complete len:274 (-) Transcript_20577:136-957(-)
MTIARFEPTGVIACVVTDALVGVLLHEEVSPVLQDHLVGSAARLEVGRPDLRHPPLLPQGRRMRRVLTVEARARRPVAINAFARAEAEPLVEDSLHVRLVRLHIRPHLSPAAPARLLCGLRRIPHRLPPRLGALVIFRAHGVTLADHALRGAQRVQRRAPSRRRALRVEPRGGRADKAALAGAALLVGAAGRPEPPRGRRSFHRRRRPGLVDLHRPALVHLHRLAARLSLGRRLGRRGGGAGSGQLRWRLGMMDGVLLEEAHDRGVARVASHP